MDSDLLPDEPSHRDRSAESLSLLYPNGRNFSMKN